MATRGPKPTPTSIRALNGDPHKARYNEHEPQFTRPTTGMPPHVKDDAIAAEMWEWAFPRLLQVGVLTDGDMLALEMLALAYSDWRTKRTNSTFKFLHTMLCEFGLTPSARTRLVGNMPHEGKSKMASIVGG